MPVLGTALKSKAAALALAGLLTPAGGFHGPFRHGHAAHFRAGAAVADFSSPLSGHVPGHDPADCASTAVYSGPRQFAFEEPYSDVMHDGHYDGPTDVTNPSSLFPGDPIADRNANARWDGNLLGG